MSNPREIIRRPKAKVNSIREGIDLVAKRYPKEIANYRKVSERITEETTLPVSEKQVWDYYESDQWYEDCVDKFVHMRAMGMV